MPRRPSTARWWQQATAAGQYLLQKQRMLDLVPAGVRHFRLGLWLKVSVPLLLLEGFTLMMTNLDILMLNVFVPPDDIGLYFAAARTISLVAFVHFAITAVAMPRFTALAVEGDGPGIRRMLARDADVDLVAVACRRGGTADPRQAAVVDVRARLCRQLSGDAGAVRADCSPWGRRGRCRACWW